jgi:hypothetical protein
MFGKTKYVDVPVYYAVPVDNPKEYQLTDELRGSIAALAHNPGFQYLLNRAKVVKAYLQRQLAEGKHESMRDVQYLQAGIYWADFWQKELSKNSQPVKPPEAVSSDTEAFEAAKAALEVVGISDE